MKDTTPKEKRRCCAMDVHKDTVVMRVLPPDGEEGQPVKKVYGTFRNDPGRMCGWLKQLKVTRMAMESTGVYWRPMWSVLEGHGFNLGQPIPNRRRCTAARAISGTTPRVSSTSFLYTARLSGFDAHLGDA